MKYLLLLFLCIAQSTFAQKTVDQLLEQYNTRSIPYISVEELRALQMNENVLILDTREPAEFNISKIEGSECVGFNNFSAQEISEKVTDKNQLIVVYCSLGIRSEEIGEKLKKNGYTNIKNLYGGIFAWKNKGYPVFDISEKETDSVHAFSKYWSQWLTNGVPVFKKIDP